MLPKHRPFRAVVWPMPSGLCFAACRWPRWTAEYARTLPPPLLMERALLRTTRDDDWDAPPGLQLRRHFRAPNACIRAPHPTLVAHLPQLAAQLLGGLEAAFDVEVDAEPVAAVLALINVALGRSVFRGLPLPDALGRGTRLVATITARLLVAAAAAAWLDLPSVAAQQHMRYVADLFMDTHVDWLAAAIMTEHADDDYWIGSAEGRALLTRVYPLPARVVCAEELPHLGHLLARSVELRNALGDTSKSKRVKDLISTIEHCLLRKQHNAICHSRHIAKGLRTGAAAYPVVGALLCQILHAVLAGNLPNIVGRRPALALRVRLALAFGPQWTSHGGGDATADAICTWADAAKVHNQALLGLLQEHFAHVCESEGVVDVLFEQRSVRWADFKQARRDTNAKLRAALEAQVLHDFWAPLRWATHVPIARIVMEGHDQFLSSHAKNAKGRPGVVIAKKMVAVGAFLVVVHSVRVLDGWPWARAAVAALYGVAEPLPLDDLARRVLGLEPGPALPLCKLAYPVNLDLFAAEALLRGPSVMALYARALGRLLKKDKTQGSAVPSFAMDALPAGAIHAAAALVDAAATASARDAVALTALAARLRTAESPFVALCEYAAEETFLPALRARVAALEQPLELMAWHAARQAMLPSAPYWARTVMQTHWLQVLGLPRVHCQTVRQWIYEYVVADHADDDYRRCALELGRASLETFVIVARFFRRQEFYRYENTIQCRPTSEAQRQLLALRDKLGVEPWEATPPRAGLAAYCRHCYRWATVVRLPGSASALGASEHYNQLLDGDVYCPLARKHLDPEPENEADELPPLTELLGEEGGGGDDDDNVEAELEIVDEHEEDVDEDDDGDPEEEDGAEPRSRRRGQGEGPDTRDRRQLSQLLAPLMPSKTIVKTCADHPLVFVDLVGVWFRLLNRGFFGLCVYCGELTSVAPSRVTAAGLTCGNHSMVPASASSKGRGKKQALRAEVLVDVTWRHPLVLDEPVRCIACGHHFTNVVVRVFDAHYKVWELPLCHVDRGLLTTALAPQLSAGRDTGKNGFYPLALHDVLDVFRHPHRSMTAPTGNDES